MTDIVEDLRSAVAPSLSICLKAANEIMRLRNDRLDCQLALDCQELEIERLRKLCSERPPYIIPEAQ